VTVQAGDRWATEINTGAGSVNTSSGLAGFAPIESVNTGVAGFAGGCQFGKLVLIQEAENQIVTHYQVCEQRPADSTLLEGSLEQHVQQFGRAPQSVAADPGSFSAANEFKAEQMGVRRVSVPSHPST
jgi:hypothetical protein